MEAENDFHKRQTEETHQNARRISKQLVRGLYYKILRAVIFIHCGSFGRTYTALQAPEDTSVQEKND